MYWELHIYQITHFILKIRKSYLIKFGEGREGQVWASNVQINGNQLAVEMSYSIIPCYITVLYIGLYVSNASSVCVAKVALR